MKQLVVTVQTPAVQQRLLIPRELQSLRLTDVLRRSSFALNTRCGGRGLCDGCLIQVKSGVLRHHTTGQHVNGTHSGLVRACEHQLDSEDVTLTIPPRSMLAYEPQIVSNFKVNISRAHDPVWRCVEVKKPGTCEQIVGEMAKHIGTTSVKLDAAMYGTICRQLEHGSAFVTAECLEQGWSVTGVRGEAPKGTLGVAIDIGTTTVALLVVDLATGKVEASAAGFNRQMHLGDDVLTRINLCTTDKAMLGRLQWAIVKDTIERILLKALRDSQISDERIACFNIAGNTTMLHLFAGVDPSPMGFAPFNAPFLNHKVIPASSVNLKLTSPVEATSAELSTASPDPNLHLLASAAAYVGADITAGVVSSGLVYDDGPSMLVDVGTNGEIVLKHRDRMWGTATAAGPAFEGSRMACGMRAGQGAVSHVRMERTAGGLEVHCEVIGDVKPTGICGSAYVDILAQARKVGLLSPTGRFEQGLADDRVGPYRDYGTCFRITTGHGQEPIVVSESDIASLLQAKAAIAAGILTLLRRLGVSPGEVRTLYLAGGFGMHLDIANTIACGLLPEFTQPQVQLVGNTSLAGAYLSMLDVGVLSEISRVAKGIEMVELNLDPEFEDCYIDQLSLR